MVALARIVGLVRSKDGLASSALLSHVGARGALKIKERPIHDLVVLIEATPASNPAAASSSEAQLPPTSQ